MSAYNHYTRFSEWAENLSRISLCLFLLADWLRVTDSLLEGVALLEVDHYI